MTTNSKVEAGVRTFSCEQFYQQGFFKHVNMGDSSGYLSEEPVTEEKRKKGWRMSCDVDEATEELENEL